MSYSHVPRRASFRGLGLFDDLPTTPPTVQAAAVQALQPTISTAEDIAKQQAIAFAQTQLANYPSQAEVLAQYNEYSGYLNAIPGFKVSDLKDPSKCVGVMKEALLNYAAANGIEVPTTTAAAKAEAEKQLEAYALKVASGAVGVDLSAFQPLPTNAKSLEKACVSMAVTAVIMDTGVDPRLVTVTFECLKDGKLSAADCVAIGKCAGALAGAVVAQAFGIPAPIGAFLGGLVGGEIGGFVGDAIGLSNKEYEKRQAAENAAFAAWQAAVLAEAQPLCVAALTVYWDNFDNMLAGTELRWRMAETQIGWQFGIRWFGQEHDNLNGRAFSQSWDPTAQKFTGPVTTANRAEVLIKNTNYGYYSGATNTLHTSSVYWCPYDYGCPYPQTPSLGGGIYERDAQAFLARGARWMSPATRNLQCTFKPISYAGGFNNAAADWAYYVQQTVLQEQASIEALNIISVTVSGDLVRTAAQVAAEKAMHDMLTASSDQIVTAGIDRATALRAAVNTGTQLSDLLNYGALFVGLGVLGAAIYKKHKP